MYTPRHFRPGDHQPRQCVSQCTAVVAVSVTAAACGSNSRVADDAAAAARAPEWFTERAADAGIDFMHFNGMSGAYYFPEVMPPGVGLLDYDNDGDLDLYLVQGQTLGTGAPLRPPAGPLTGRLLRNDLHVGPPTARRCSDFTDVTGASAPSAASGYGMGVAAGDIDNDGWTDLYVTYFGRNQMWRNNGNGTFTDVSARSGTDLDGLLGVGCVRRLRPRRMARPLRRQLRPLQPRHRSAVLEPRRRADLLSAAGLPCPARSPVPQSRERHVRRRHGDGARSAASSGGRSASRPRISMAMAGSTSTSPTTGARTSCGPTSATGRSGTRRCSPASP